MATKARRRAVIYTRQSTWREESISLELQETAAREHAAREGYEVVGVEADAGLTGRTFKRPGVAAAMDMLERRAADVIVLWKWSRLSRNRLDWYLAADRAATAGGVIEAAAEPIDTSTSIGRLARGLMIEISAFESERAGDQWREAQERRVSMGLPPHGKDRFGYQRDPETKGFVHDPVTAPILAELYQRFVAGESFNGLALWLESARVPSVRGGRWTAAGVQQLLDRGFGAGLITYHGEQRPGIHEPVIDEATWAAYQVARKRRAGRPRGEGSTYLLSGLIWCATCQRRMDGWTVGRGERTYAYYRCGEPPRSRTHDSMTIPVATVEQRVLETVQEIAQRAPEHVDLAEQRRPEADIDALQAEVDRARRALSRLTVRNAQGAVSDDAYDAAAPDLQQRLDSAREALLRVQAVPAQPEPGAAAAIDLLRDWHALSVRIHREQLQHLIASVTVDFTDSKAVHVEERRRIR
ncbi:recombinase family protein [Brachybacterium phenoliresistens]|uniref:recombinase family protein n=1 Tax=Brachybacterium phenoliresistens TaxID=396014 RepID=UPI0031D9C186